MFTGRRALCLGLIAVACDVKTGGERETKAPGRHKPRKRRPAPSGGLDHDPAVIQAAVELERQAGLHLRLIGDADAADDGRSAAAMREAVLRRGGGRIAPERVHVEPGGDAAVRFDFYYPPEPTPPEPAAPAPTPP